MAAILNLCKLNGNLCKFGVIQCSGIINTVIIVFGDPENICVDIRMKSPRVPDPEICAKVV